MSRLLGMIILAVSAVPAIAMDDDSRPAMERVKVATDGRGFVLAPSDRPFAPWGFNYDHDEQGRLLEDYWDNEWPKVEADFREMAEMGANVVRVHLQFGRFMEAADRPNTASLDRLERLLRLAEETRLYLDLTGLGCYHKQDVPAWYDALDEPARWAAQAAFWKAVAARCRPSPAVFCYDLMNEPVVPGDPPRSPGDWLAGAFGGKHFVQFIALGAHGRPRKEVARDWVAALTAAVREVDPDHLVTVGMVDWSLDRPGLSSGFVPEFVAGPLDFLCVHIYPEKGKVDDAIATLKGFTAVGKPVVIEETFPLKAGPDDFRAFLDRTRPLAAGWVGFYWGRTREDSRAAKTIGDAITASWLDLFVELAPKFRQP